MRTLFQIKWIIVIGLLMRLAFMHWGAPIYYGTPNYAIEGGDTHAWVACMQNLVHTGTYTADPNYEDGKYFRPPGYAFFLMLFYFISGFNLELTYFLAGYAQILLDTLSIFLVYKIVLLLSKNEKLSLLTSTIYCIYPFSLVWTPVLYAESPSLFFMFLTLYLLLKEEGKYNTLWAGILMGANVLLRLQTIFFVPAIAFYFWKKNGDIKILFQKKYLYFFIAFGLTYGSWPIRNLFHGRFMPAEELSNDKHFSEDYYEFMYYIWSVKTDHRPQYDQLIRGEAVEWPKASYLHPGDSATLAHISHLCSTCGRGFSHFKKSEGLIDTPIKEYTACTKEIGETFHRLKLEQIKDNSFHYYIIVPLSNLKKALFKFSLYGNKGLLVQLVSSMLFSIRTFFILLGIYGFWLNRKLKILPVAFTQLCIAYFLIWYLVLCFGFRNIEIRYFLSTDVLLLIPATIPIYIFIKKYFSKNNLIIEKRR